jgi:peroxiredoxin
VAHSLTFQRFAVVAVAAATLHLSACNRRPAFRRAAVAPRVGCLAPDFDLRDQRGRHWRLDRMRGRPVTLVFACGCSDCRRLLGMLSCGHAQGVLVITSSLSPALQHPAEGIGTRFPLLFDPFSATAIAYSSLRCPAVWVVGPRGIIAYRSRPDRGGIKETVAHVLQWCRR